jgi:hypothetical protein
MFVENPLNSSELAFPVLECIHILGFALSVGTIAIVDFRLLGLGMNHSSADEESDTLSRPWTKFTQKQLGIIPRLSGG